MKDKNKEDVIEVFPARTEEQVQVKSAILGKTEKRKDGTLVWVPDISTAQGRTERFHIGQHLNHTIDLPIKVELSADAKMGIQDILLHTKYMPDNIPISVLRDEKAAAYNDLRMSSYIINALKKYSSDKMPPSYKKWWNISCLLALRAKAILKKNAVKSNRKYKFKLPSKIDRTLNGVLAKTNRGSLGVAAKRLEKILLKIPDEPDRSKDPMPKEDPKDFSIKLPFAVPFGKPRPKIGKERGDKSNSPDDKRPKMPYQELEMTVKTEQRSHSRNYRHKDSGSMPNPFKLARASFSPVTNLFKVKLRKKETGGTFLLDASGSMGINAAGLSLILEKLPTATVAYYSGLGLTVYAKDGKRYGGSRFETDGANDWDHQAIQWLLKQKPPYFYVTDEHFCCDHGYDPGQEQLAHRLLKNNRSKIHMYRSYNELVEHMHHGDLLKILEET